MDFDSDILFVKPNFLRGVSRVIDFWGDTNLYNDSPTEVEADDLAMRSDVAAIGNDLRKAITNLEQQLKHQSVQK